MDADVIKTYPAIWFLYNDVDGERSMTYDGARVRCGRWDCEGFTDQLECPKGCGVRIESNQEERSEQYRREMTERDAERKRYREQIWAARSRKISGSNYG